MQVVIPSRKRVDECRGALELFSDAIVTVAESEMDDYAVLGLGDRLIPHPDSVAGIGPIRQWVLDNIEEETIVMADDDVFQLRISAGRMRKASVTRDPNVVAQVLENAEMMARGFGTPIFGFDQGSGDVRKFHPHDPIKLNSWTGGIIGIIGRDLRYDTSLLLRADIDFCLKAILKYRVVCIDTRFAFVHKRFKNKGGNDHVRSSDRNRLEIERLKDRWGKWLALTDAKTTLRLNCKVPRRQ